MLGLLDYQNEINTINLQKESLLQKIVLLNNQKENYDSIIKNAKDSINNIYTKNAQIKLLDEEQKSFNKMIDGQIKSINNTINGYNSLCDAIINPKPKRTIKIKRELQFCEHCGSTNAGSEFHEGHCAECGAPFVYKKE